MKELVCSSCGKAPTPVEFLSSIRAPGLLPGLLRQVCSGCGEITEVRLHPRSPDSLEGGLPTAAFRGRIELGYVYGAGTARFMPMVEAEFSG